MLAWCRTHVIAIATTAGIVGGAVVSIAGAWAIVEPAVPVLRYEMRTYVPIKAKEVIAPLQTAQSEQTQALYSLQIDQAESACEKAADEIIVMSALLPKETDPIARERKAFQLVQKKQRYDDLDRKLKGWRGGRGCPYSTGQ